MARAASQVLGWIAERIPTVLVWAGLAGLFVYGKANDWKFGEGKADTKEGKAQADQEGEGRREPPPKDQEPFTPYYQERPFDVPIQVTHDPKACEIGQKPIPLKSIDAVIQAGIKTAPVRHDWISVTIAAHGDVQPDPTATARVSPRVGGALVALQKELGDPVHKGELLALVESADVGRVKAAYLTARAVLQSRQLVRASLSPGVSPTRSIVDAEAAVREAQAASYSARQAVANLGLPLPSAAEEALPDEEFTRRLLLLGVPFLKRVEILAHAASTGQPPTANLLPVFSPLDGVVVRRMGVVGETVAALQQVYDVGDPLRVYVYLDVRQEDMRQVAIGQEMTFRVEGWVGQPSVSGTTDWISPVVDDKTRTVRVRGRVANPSGVLKGGAFGAGTIAVEPRRQALVVPTAAVHWEGCSQIVFVKKVKKAGGNEEVEFWPRKVKLGVRSGGVVEVTAGLGENEEVAVTGSHVLKNELLKSLIGEAEE